MLNSILNLKKQLSFLSEQTISKIHTISIDHATLIINEEGLILYLNNQASLLLHISEQSNIFSDTIIASFPSFKTIISKSVGNYKLPLIIDNIEYIVELECITQGDVNAHLCVFYKQTQNTSTSLTYSILLFPSPVLVFSNDYVLETFNNAAFEFFFDRATFEIGEKLLAISPEIHTILSNTTDENKLFKKNQVKFHNQNYLVDFQIISISKHQKLIQFINSKKG